MASTPKSAAEHHLATVAPAVRNARTPPPPIKAHRLGAAHPRARRSAGGEQRIEPTGPRPSHLVAVGAVDRSQQLPALERGEHVDERDDVGGVGGVKARELGREVPRAWSASWRRVAASSTPMRSCSSARLRATRAIGAICSYRSSRADTSRSMRSGSGPPPVSGSSKSAAWSAKWCAMVCSCRSSSPSK